MQNQVSDIRKAFCDLFWDNEVADNGTFEIINASFVADEATIFGSLNEDYMQCEIDWYMSQSRCVFDMPCKTPKIWEQVSSNQGLINSNYGWCIFSEENYNQFEKAIQALVDDEASRQSAMIYIRPTMHEDAFEDGMKDFMCTYAAQMLIRNGKLHYVVYMRSNDAVFGYKNDRHWHDVVFNMAIDKLKATYPKIKKGNLYWNAASLHVYPRHFNLIDEAL